MSLLCKAEDITIRIDAGGKRSLVGGENYSVEQARTILHPGKSDGVWLEIHDVRDNSQIGNILIFLDHSLLQEKRFPIFISAAVSKNITLTCDVSGYKTKLIKIEGKYRTYEAVLEKINVSD